MATNPNSFDFFNKDEVFPFIQGKQKPNDFDLFNKDEVFPVIFSSPTTPSSPASSPVSRRRLFIID